MEYENDESKPMPDGMYGYTVTDRTGSVVENNGKITNSLHEYVAYINQLGGLLGASLGFNDVEEMVLLGKNRHTICLEVEDLHYGAIYKAKSDRHEISQFMHNKAEENDVLG
ncbi:MAG: hypothetical protein GVY36_04630 [Verrucomicrobia bacterium]|jgi:hypothetical protein|nr:hypothetical protein [Verrucomicrobiota bacterium]